MIHTRHILLRFFICIKNEQQLQNNNNNDNDI